MTQCIELLPHECGSSDALQVFQNDRGNYTGYCFSCDTYVADPYGDSEGHPPKKVQKSAENILAELQEISRCPTVPLPERKLNEEALSYFDVKMGLSEQDGTTPVLHYYPYYKGDTLVAYKARLIEGKNFWSVGDIKEGDLFGWKQALEAGAKALYIVEGELDAVSLYQALNHKAKGSRWASYAPAVVSLKNGASSAKRDLAALLPAISSNFKEVVLVFDQDEAGQAAVKDVMQIIPYAKTVTLPAKDPNECLTKGFAHALCNAVLFKRDKPKNTRLVRGAPLRDKARQETPMGMDWPWKGLTDLTRGVRFGETIYLGAGVKMGKTTMVDTLAAHFITKYKLNIFCAQPEELASETYKHVAGKVAKRIFHDPQIEFDYEAFDKVSPIVDKHLTCLDLYQDLDWNMLRMDINQAVEEGCQIVLVDPITNLTNGIDAASANTLLQEFAQEISVMAKDSNIVVFLFCHLKAPHDGKPHERGGKVFSSQFAGSRAMMRSCHMMLGLEGNKDPDLDIAERNMRRLTVLEDRAYGSSGYIVLYYDDKTGLYHEIEER
jgi:twinkle protein